MGNRAMYPGQSGGSVGRVYAEIKLKLNGASAPTVLAGNSWLSPTSPPTHTAATNVIGVTLRDAWPEVVAHSASVRDDANTGSYAECGSFANEGSTAVPALPITFNVNTFNSGGSALNNSTLVITIQLALRNSSTTYGNTP